MTHAFFKALLFLGAGSVIHAMHHAYHATHSHDDAQDMRNMGGLKQYMPATFWLMLIATLAIAGIPPFSGFFSKDEILAAAFARGGDQPIYYVFYGMGVVAALLTAFYMARLITMTFLGENRTGEQGAGSSARCAPGHDGAARGARRAEPGRRVAQPPALLGRTAALEHWLEPVIAPSQAFFGSRCRTAGRAVSRGRRRGDRHPWSVCRLPGYMGRSIVRAHESPPDRGLALVLNRKYYVDEIYDAVIVRPLRMDLTNGAVERCRPDPRRRGGGQWRGQAVPRHRLGGKQAAVGPGGFLRGRLPGRCALGPPRRAAVSGAMTHLLESIGYDQWILHVLVVLPLIGVVPIVLGDERSAKGWPSCVTTLEFVLSVGFWWSLDPSTGGCSSSPTRHGSRAGASAIESGWTASRSSWSC